MVKEFTYRGYLFKEILQMPMDEFVTLLPSKARRKMLRGLPIEHRKILERIRKLRERGLLEKTVIKTHCRNMLILPEMVGATFAIHNGKDFVHITVKPEMIGHLLGEFSMTCKKVDHGAPGVGASRSSMYVPLK
ncbi:MAG: 30S ribosomal protein S19 [Candidatus Bathyarchaeota archaeon]|nr:30S ribosomal protein S19 [Candidatus Bathyarchaeota archaeon]